MSMKPTDLVKNLAKKLDGRMKSANVPKRFAQGSAAMAASKPQRAGDAQPKLVAVACRLPADLVNQLRARAVGYEGGVNALIAEALEQSFAAGSKD